MTGQQRREEVIIAGFGGQGIILAGKLLAQIAMRGGNEVTFIPSYGAEMRGGTANCSVIIASVPIACPFIDAPDSLVIMNNASFEKFTPRIKPDGLIIFNSSLVAEDSANNLVTDADILSIPADAIAIETGNVRIANMVMLGAYLRAKNLVSPDEAANALPNVLAKRYHSMLGINTEALRRGAQFAENHFASLK